ncbi:MAG: hypothetical protein ACFFDU_00860 [Candidatus Thorarchaeota archaeon]
MSPTTNDTESTLPPTAEAAQPLTIRVQSSIISSFQLYRKWWKEISLGIFVRLLTLAAVLYIASSNPTFPDVNDMNELLTQGLNYVFVGLNPYNRDYWLTALAAGPCDLYYQNFINYGPGSLLIHIPCMVYPYSFDFAGCMDFQPSFMVLHGFFDFLLFDRMVRHGNRASAVFIWINPIMVTLNFVTHMSVVLFLIWMGYEKWKDPFWSIFWLGLGAITYQYIGLILLFAIAYHFHHYRKWIVGVLPAVIIFGLFQVWASMEALLYSNPSRHLALIHDLLLVQFGRPYEVWPLHIQSWWSWTGSIPAVTFNVYWIVANNTWASLGFPTIDPTQWILIGDPLQIITRSLLPPEGLRISTVFSIIALLVSIYLLVKLLMHPDSRKSILYSVISMGLFLIGAPAGIWHHNFIVIIPLFFLLTYNRGVRSSEDAKSSRL